MAVRIIVDSAADMEKEELEQMNVRLVPMSIIFDEEMFLDGVTIDKAQFYHKLVHEKIFPKTAQPSPEAFYQEFLEAKEAEDEVVVITISSALSGTFQSANIAKEMAEYDNIYLIDSMSATLGQRILVDMAVKERSLGQRAGQIAEKLESVKEKITITAVVDTLEYLQKGGRLTRAEAGIGTLANLKPIITLNQEGKVEMTDKALGKKRAFYKIVAAFAKAEIDREYPAYFVYTMEEDNCDTMISMIEAAGYEKEYLIKKEIGGTIGAHVGNGAFGFVYISK